MFSKDRAKLESFSLIYVTEIPKHQGADTVSINPLLSTYQLSVHF